MNKEEAISVIENEIQIDVRLCTDEQVKRFQEALYMAISALGAMHTDHFPDLTKMVPLTLEELKSMEGQKVLLYRMKSTEPLELGTVKQNGDVMGDAGMLAYHELYLETWVAFSYQAQKKPDFDKPLTLEQLRGMRGKWVHIVLIDGEPEETAWALVGEKKLVTYLSYDSCKYVAKAVFNIEECGKEFLAYTYPPAHIDREAFCGSWEGEADGYADGELVYDVWRCSGCGHVEETDDPDLLPDFCPDCGLALTEKAQAILEKRLRG